MYSLNEQQIDFILSDINTRGVKLESIQYDSCWIIFALLSNSNWKKRRTLSSVIKQL